MTTRITTTCPTDGKALRLLDPVPTADTPPFLCDECVRGYWPAELTPAARALWDPLLRTHGTGEAAEVVRLAAVVDRDTAREQARLNQ